MSTGVGLQTRHSPASDAASAAGQYAAHEFEQLAADRIEGTAAASVVEPPQLAEISSDDIAFAFLSADDGAVALCHLCTRQGMIGTLLWFRG